MRALLLTFYLLLMGAAVLSSATADEILQPKVDGWHTWQVDEPGVSSEMCCLTWKRGDNSRKGCNLDGHSIAFSNSGDCAVAPGTIQVYARLDNGKPKDIRVLSSNCPVSTESEVADHGLVSAGESLAWFQSIIENRRLDMDIREEALFGLVQSESDAAFDYIDSLLTQR
jgi:hypothetical protein